MDFGFFVDELIEADAFFADAGFILEEAYDISIPDSENPVPWYADFDADGLINGLKHWHATKFGRTPGFFVFIPQLLRLRIEMTRTWRRFILTASSLL